MSHIALGFDCVAVTMALTEELLTQNINCSLFLSCCLYPWHQCLWKKRPMRLNILSLQCRKNWIEGETVGVIPMVPINKGRICSRSRLKLSSCPFYCSEIRLFPAQTLEWRVAFYLCCHVRVGLCQRIPVLLPDLVECISLTSTTTPFVPRLYGNKKDVAVWNQALKTSHILFLLTHETVITIHQMTSLY